MTEERQQTSYEQFKSDISTLSFLILLLVAVLLPFLLLYYLFEYLNKCYKKKQTKDLLLKFGYEFDPVTNFVRCLACQDREVFRLHRKKALDKYSKIWQSIYDRVICFFTEIGFRSKKVTENKAANKIDKFVQLYMQAVAALVAMGYREREIWFDVVDVISYGKNIDKDVSYIVDQVIRRYANV
jgi:hypothetical protein